MKPKRIQRKRTKGWRMPDNAVYVGRPTKWANPFSIGKIVPDDVPACIKWMDHADFQAYIVRDNEIPDRETAVRLFKQFIESGYFLGYISEKFENTNGSEPHIWSMGDYFWFLRGRDLACWCPVGHPCHADVLLEMANK